MSQIIPQNFLGPATPTNWRRNFGNIGVIGEKRKNVNAREIEIGSGRGQVTSSFRRVTGVYAMCKFGRARKLSTLLEFTVFLRMAPVMECNGNFGAYTCLLSVKNTRTESYSNNLLHIFHFT